MDYEESEAVAAICSLRTATTSFFADKNQSSAPENKSHGNRKYRKPRKSYYVKKWERAFLPKFPLKPPNHYILLPNADPRCQYPNRIVSFLDNGDGEGLKSLIHEICVPNLQTILQYDGEQNPYGPNYRELRGTQEFVDFYLAVMHTAPDAVIALYKDSVKATRDPVTDEAFITFKLMSSQTIQQVIHEKEQVPTTITTNTDDVPVANEIVACSDEEHQSETDSSPLKKQQKSHFSEIADNSSVTFTAKEATVNIVTPKVSFSLDKSDNIDSLLSASSDGLVGTTCAVSSGGSRSSNSKNDSYSSSIINSNKVSESMANPLRHTQISGDIVVSANSNVNTFFMEYHHNNSAPSPTAKSAGDTTTTTTPAVVAINKPADNLTEAVLKLTDCLLKGTDFLEHNSSVVDLTAGDVDSLVSNFNSFKLEAIANPTVTTYHCGTYVLVLNKEHKITGLYNFFKCLTYKPAFI